MKEVNSPTTEQTAKSRDIIRDFFRDYSSAKQESLFFDVWCACAVVDDRLGHTDRHKKDILEYLERGRKVLDATHLLIDYYSLKELLIAISQQFTQNWNEQPTEVKGSIQYVYS